MKQTKVSYAEWMEICKICDLQPNHLFACIRKSMRISQAKLAYYIDTEGINQNTISKYEHKNCVKANQEYILWSNLLHMLNVPRRRTQSANVRYAAEIQTALNLYILIYATDKQAVMIANFIAEVINLGK